MGLQLRFVLCGVLVAAMFAHPAHAAEFAGASGMAWISGSSYLCVQDLKSNRQGSRVGILTIDTEHGGYDYLPLEPDWGADLPHDMESVYGFKTRPGEFLMAESGSYENWDTHEYHIGRIFHVKLVEEQGGWLFSVLGTIPIPENIHEIEGMYCTAVSDHHAWNGGMPGEYMWQDMNGSFAQFGSEDPEMTEQMDAATSGEEISIVLGSRGGNQPYEPAMLYYCQADLASHAMTNDGGSGVELSVPNNGNPWERGCSDLYLDSMGVLWVASCSDRGDNGPFDSRIYRYGNVMNQYNGGGYFGPYSTISWHLGGVKVEAICMSVIPGSTLCYATDDEGFGGIWRSLGPAINSGF